MPESQPDPHQIIDFWQQAGPARWFARDAAFDDEIRRRFEVLIEPAASGELDAWQQSAKGMLALILILDQFPRNLYRDSAKAFAYDEKAVRLTQKAIENGYDKSFAPPLKRFVYMPFMHAEDLELQQRLIDLCQAAGDVDGVKWGEIHADVIRRFRRFPHRNAVLGRDTTPEEQAFLDSGGFSG